MRPYCSLTWNGRSIIITDRRQHSFLGHRPWISAAAPDLHCVAAVAFERADRSAENGVEKLYMEKKDCDIQLSS
jgi:hypothetical protein